MNKTTSPEKEQNVTARVADSNHTCTSHMSLKKARSSQCVVPEENYKVLDLNYLENEHHLNYQLRQQAFTCRYNRVSHLFI